MYVYVCIFPQVYICHDQDTGRELAVKMVDIVGTESLQMHRVSNVERDKLGVWVCGLVAFNTEIRSRMLSICASTACA